MASRVQSINGKIPNTLLKEQKIKYNSNKYKTLDSYLNDGSDSIDNIKKIVRCSSYNESNVKNSANTLKWEDESDDDGNILQSSSSKANEQSLENFSRNNNNSFYYNSFDNNKISRSLLLRKNYEDLTQFDNSNSYEKHEEEEEEEEKTLIKCPSCPEKIFRKNDEMTVFENKNADEIDFYTNEKIESNNCWTEISKLRHFSSNIELYSPYNKKSKTAYNFLEEFVLNEGINYLSDFGIHNSNGDFRLNEDGFYPLQHSNNYIHSVVDLDNEDSENDDDDDDDKDIKNYINQKRKIIEMHGSSDLSKNSSSSIELNYSMNNDLNNVDDSKNTLIASFNSLQINQCYGKNDSENNKILEVFDFIKEYKNIVNSISIKYEKDKIIINEKPLENRIHYSLDEYQEVKTVGNGAYGKLVECVHLPTGKRVILKRIPVCNINHWYINDVMTMEEYSLRKNIHPRIITLHDAFFYHPSPPENENEDENENENEKSVAKITKSQTFASNIKLKFKNLNKVLKVGKKKKRKEKGKEKEKDIDNNKNQNNEEKIVEDEQQQLQEEEKQQQIQQNQQPQQPQQQDDQQQQPQQDEQQQQQQQQDEFILVTESLGKGSMDLYDYIETIGPIPEDNVRYIFAQIIEAVYFMSKNGFSHGDIKDENILIEPSTFRIKLIDFGSATTNIEHAEIPYIKFRGTRKYQAPNIYNKDTFDPLAQDVWSLGVMFFVMLFAADPFTSPEEAASVDILEQLHENIQYIRVEKGMDVSEEAIDLIMKMLEKDETARITLEEIIYHPFFRI